MKQVACAIVPFVLILSINGFSAHENAVFYGGLTHQHRDFYGKPFSYTGIEAGAVIRRHFAAGAYGSTFLSALEAEIAGVRTHLLMRQCGLFFGIMTSDTRRIHAGLLLHAGYVSIHGDRNGISMFRNKNGLIEAGGRVVDPQLFGETNLTGWLKIRMGLAYDVYCVEERTMLHTSDIAGVSLNFGFMVGNFSENKSCF